jgi:TRAP-type mannitol/chloroaromatic compound transport system permease small subunit
MDALIRNIERVTGSVGIMAAFALVPLVIATCYEVFARYLFGMPTIWAYEVGYILTGAHFLLGMAFTLQSNEHIRIDIFSAHFSQRTRAVIDLLGYSSCCRSWSGFPMRSSSTSPRGICATSAAASRR